MKARFAKRCDCDVSGKIVTEKANMTYGYQIETVVQCPKCGKIFRELPGKGPVISDIKTPEEKAAEEKKRKLDEEKERRRKERASESISVIDPAGETHKGRLTVKEKAVIDMKKKKVQEAVIERKNKNV